MRTLFIIAMLLAGILLARWSFFTVDASEYVYETVLGRPVATYDGAVAEQAGLHFGWPWPITGLVRVDRRTQLFDLPTAELLTHDPGSKTTDKTLSVDAYVLWKISDREAVDRFIKRLGSAERARAILGPLINSQLGAAIGVMRMDDLVSTDTSPAGGTRVDETIRKLRAGLLDKLSDEVRDKYGIDLIDIRLRRFSHPAEVRASIFERIRSERGTRVREYQSEGERRAQNIATKADRETNELIEKAKFAAEEIKSKADTEALQIRNQAQSQDPEFFDFLKRMEKLQSILGDSKSTLLLSTHREMFELLFSPPRPKTLDKAPEKKS